MKVKKTNLICTKMTEKFYFDSKLPLIQNQNNLRKNHKFCDFTLKTDDEKHEFPVHKIILTSISSYFEKLFDTNEYNGDYLKIGKISGENLEKIIEYMYTGGIKLNQLCAEEILNIALLFKLQGLVKLTVYYLIESIDENTVWDLMRCECKAVEHKLKIACCKWILRNIENVRGLKQIQEMSLYDMHNLLSTNRPFGCSEEQVQCVLLRWIEYDLTARKRHLDDLMKFIRFDKISEELRQKQEAENNTAIRKNVNFIAKIREVFKDYTRQRAPIDIEMIPMPVNRNRGEDESIYAVTNEGIYKFYEDDGQLLFLSSFVNKRQNFACTLVDKDKIFIGGGITENGLISCLQGNAPCHLFSVRNNTWSRLPSMTNVKKHSLAVSLNNKIYAMDKYNCDLEVFDPAVGCWSSIEVPNFDYNLTSLCTLNGCIFALTGWGFHCLDLRQFNKKWCWKSLPKQGEYFSGALGYKNYLYAFNYQGACVFDIRTNRWFNDFELNKNLLKKYKNTPRTDSVYAARGRRNIQHIPVMNFKEELCWDVKACLRRNKICLCDSSSLQIYKANNFEFCEAYRITSIGDENLYGLFAT